MRLVLGPKWSESGRIFQIFGPGIGAMLLCSTVGWIHLSIGKPGRWLRWNLIALAVNRLLVSGGAALGTCGSRRGVEHFLLDPLDSGLLVCWATDRVWCLRSDFRDLEIRCRSPGGGISNCRDHPRQATSGILFQARALRSRQSSLFQFCFLLCIWRRSSCFIEAWRRCDSLPVCCASWPRHGRQKNRPTNVLGDSIWQSMIEANCRPSKWRNR